MSLFALMELLKKRVSPHLGTPTMTEKSLK
jgi:hypothetical protein